MEKKLYQKQEDNKRQKQQYRNNSEKSKRRDRDVKVKQCSGYGDRRPKTANMSMDKMSNSVNCSYSPNVRTMHSSNGLTSSWEEEKNPSKSQRCMSSEIQINRKLVCIKSAPVIRPPLRHVRSYEKGAFDKSSMEQICRFVSFEKTKTKDTKRKKERTFSTPAFSTREQKSASKEKIFRSHTYCGPPSYVSEAIESVTRRWRHQRRISRVESRRMSSILSLQESPQHPITCIHTQVGHVTLQYVIGECICLSIFSRNVINALASDAFDLRLIL